jgi:hypothetical protein
MHGLAGPPEEHLRFLADNGFGAVVAGATPETAAACAARGIALYLCSGAYGRGGYADEYLSVDVNGGRQVWFGSTCPNQPAVREANLRGIAAMAATDGIAGLYIDGCRFASPASGLEAFFTCFCPVCEEKAHRWGYDFPRMKADATALYRLIKGQDAGTRWTQTGASPSMLLHVLVHHPGALEWLRFREACTTEHLRDVRATIKGVNPHLMFGIYSFTPTLAPLVGQHYGRLSDGVIDLFSPMIYRNFPPPDGPACLNLELYEIGGWFGGTESAVMQAIAAFFGVPSMPRQALREKGLPPQTVGEETRRARSLIGAGTPLVPILYLDDPEIETSIRAAREAGADGVSFFTYQASLRPFVVRAGKSV